MYRLPAGEEKAPLSFILTFRGFKSAPKGRGPDYHLIQAVFLAAPDNPRRQVCAFCYNNIHPTISDKNTPSLAIGFTEMASLESWAFNTPHVAPRSGTIWSEGLGREESSFKRSIWLWVQLNRNSRSSTEQSLWGKAFSARERMFLKHKVLLFLFKRHSTRFTQVIKHSKAQYGISVSISLFTEEIT